MFQDVLVAGDLNSDCDYLPDREHAKIGLYHDDRFQWLIGDDVDTTTKGSECSYDRYYLYQYFLVSAGTCYSI